MLIALMIITALSEIVSLGALFPFLGALSNAQIFLKNSSLQPILKFLNITSAYDLVFWLTLTFILAIIIANSLRFLTFIKRAHLSTGISIDLSSQLYGNLLRQPYSYHVNQNSSQAINSVTQEADAIEADILAPLLTLLSDGVVSLALATTLLAINTSIILTAASVLILLYLGMYKWRKLILRRNSQIIVTNSQRRIKVVQEGLGGIREVLLDGTQIFFEKTYNEAARLFKKGMVSNLMIAITPRFFIEALAMSCIALLALFLGRGGDFSQVVPILGSLALGATRLLPVIQSVFTSVVKMQGARESLKRVIKKLQQPIDPLQLLPVPPPLPFNHQLQFNQVWFRYGDDGEWVLRNLSFTIQPKTTVAFVGSTGSGKSTTADLILGLLQPQKGSILVDGEPLQGKSLRAWQQAIAHVPQNIYLTDASISENIAFGVEIQLIDIQQVQEAARLAQIDRFIAELPAGYDTYVGEQGVRLSGGQRQRIGIARALYKKSSVIIFDEATSALDNETEKEVMEAINSLSHRITIILIAHRLSTIQNCDEVIELKQGEVVAKGSYQELLEKSTTFQKMVNTK